MTRISIIHSYYSSDTPSGENITVDAQAAALAARGHDVELITLSTDELRSSPLYPVRAAAAAAGFFGHDPLDALTQHAPEIVHVHNLFPNWGTKWLRRWPGPIVATLHNYRTICANGLLWRDGADCEECPVLGSHRAMICKCYRNSTIASMPLSYSTRAAGTHSPILTHTDALIVLNERAQERFTRLLPSKRVELVPNFAPESTELDADGSPSGWIYVGRLTEEKGILWLLQFWDNNTELTIVGTGPLHTHVSKKCADRKNITFLGSLSPDETISKIASSEGMIIPSLWSEGIPTVALEALQAGVPLVISDSCSAAESLTADGAGMIYQRGSHETFRNAIEKVESNNFQFKIKSAQLYKRRFSVSAWLEKIEAVYQSVL